jgi:hypothetical protein
MTVSKQQDLGPRTLLAESREDGETLFSGQAQPQKKNARLVSGSRSNGLKTVSRFCHNTDPFLGLKQAGAQGAIGFLGVGDDYSDKHESTIPGKGTPVNCPLVQYKHLPGIAVR